MASTRNALFSVTYLVLSFAAFYYMRLTPEGKSTGKFLEPLFTHPSADFHHPSHHEIIIRRHYTGIKPIDAFLSLLVTAFLAGPAGLNEVVRVQQINFLISIVPVLVVFSIESVRTRNAWSLITL
jgi:hypothetical protein